MAEITVSEGAAELAGCCEWEFLSAKSVVT